MAFAIKIPLLNGILIAEATGHLAFVLKSFLTSGLKHMVSSSSFHQILLSYIKLHLASEMFYLACSIFATFIGAFVTSDKSFPYSLSVDLWYSN